MNKWHAAIACLNAETGQDTAYADHLRSKKIMHAWLNSQKAVDAAFAAMPPEARQMM